MRDAAFADRMRADRLGALRVRFLFAVGTRFLAGAWRDGSTDHLSDRISIHSATSILVRDQTVIGHVYCSASQRPCARIDGCDLSLIL